MNPVRRHLLHTGPQVQSGYCMIEVDERNHEKTAFVTPDGLYKFKALPRPVQLQPHFSE